MNKCCVSSNGEKRGQETREPGAEDKNGFGAKEYRSVQNNAF